ncbi:hypothetical protein HNY73_013980 [Argiope bruennichi]|uniref:Uncharacterized protein n=1 Tax=Argiope bruennichi TaxID=94029 RepID=A0A8T0ERR4_ARGBR|nr:hypothetical protein HNY73_013980 [Argiope bruennichi]
MCTDVSKGGRKRNVIRNTSPHPLSPALPFVAGATFFLCEGVAQTQKPFVAVAFAHQKKTWKCAIFFTIHPFTGDGTKLTDVTCSTPKPPSLLLMGCSNSLVFEWEECHGPSQRKDEMFPFDGNGTFIKGFMNKV